MHSTPNSSKAAVSAAVILGLVTALLVLPSAAASANAQLVPSMPCISLKIDGEPVKTMCKVKANDLHVKFSGDARLVFTKEGKPISDPIKKPAGANDFHVIWSSETGQILKFWWTRNGLLMGEPIEAPRGASDLHFKVTKEINRIVWTHDGEKIGSVEVPEGTNGLHLKIRHLARV
jgi:hypothetical protein